MKVQITLDEELVKRIDTYADENYMSRSGFISLASTQYLNAQAMYKAMVDMALCMRKISEEKSIDDKTMQQLEDIEHLLKIISADKQK